MAAPSQQFCVKWNSYSTNLQSVFPRLLTSEHFVDVTLACEGQMIKCHKVVLSACSTYFERLLVANPCPHPIIFMKDMKHFEVQALVDFMYRGEVNVSQDELNSLLVAAEALQIRGLCGSDTAVNGGGGGARPRGAGHPSSSPPPPPTRGGSNESSHPHHAASKRRRSDGDARPPRIVSVTSNGEDAGPAMFRNARGPTADVEPADDSGRQQHDIKQESLDGEESYGNEPDGEVLDEEFDRLEQQEDSDGLKEESSLCTGQAGPSGLVQPPSRSGTDTPDKTATGTMVNMKLKREGIKWPIPISRKVRRMFEVRQMDPIPKVEISRDSGVCVGEDEWRRLSYVSSPTQVVRRLLLALFTPETLMRSNLRGGKCKNKRLDTGRRREKLDERVTDAIYDATVQRFPAFTKGAFGVAVNSKIAELRFHYNKK